MIRKRWYYVGAVLDALASVIAFACAFTLDAPWRSLLAFAAGMMFAFMSFVHWVKGFAQ